MENEKNAGKKAPYSTPCLTVFGDVASLTQSHGSGTKKDNTGQDTTKTS